MFPVALYALLHGDHPDLHARLIRSLPVRDDVRVTLWCNQLCPATRAALARTRFRVHASDRNVPKYRAMRQMFDDGGVPEPWVVWFDDDDAHATGDDWLDAARAFIAAHRHEDVCYLGQPWSVAYLRGKWDFVRQSAWFRGLPPQRVHAAAPGVTFAQGSYWWLRTDVLKRLDWPDPRLNHNGGDTLLAEAVRQQGLPFHPFCYGVATNDAARRGFHEAPAGACDREARR